MNEPIGTGEKSPFESQDVDLAQAIRDAADAMQGGQQGEDVAQAPQQQEPAIPAQAGTQQPQPAPAPQQQPAQEVDLAQVIRQAADANPPERWEAGKGSVYDIETKRFFNLLDFEPREKIVLPDRLETDVFISPSEAAEVSQQRGIVEIVSTDSILQMLAGRGLDYNNTEDADTIETILAHTQVEPGLHTIRVFDNAEVARRATSRRGLSESFKEEATSLLQLPGAIWQGFKQGGVGGATFGVLGGMLQDYGQFYNPFAQGDARAIAQYRRAHGFFRVTSDAAMVAATVTGLGAPAAAGMSAGRMTSMAARGAARFKPGGIASRTLRGVGTATSAVDQFANVRYARVGKPIREAINMTRPMQKANKIIADAAKRAPRATRAGVEAARFVGASTIAPDELPLRTLGLGAGLFGGRFKQKADEANERWSKSPYYRRIKDSMEQAGMPADEVPSAYGYFDENGIAWEEAIAKEAKIGSRFGAVKKAEERAYNIARLNRERAKAAQGDLEAAGRFADLSGELLFRDPDQIMQERGGAAAKLLEDAGLEWGRGSAPSFLKGVTKLLEDPKAKDIYGEAELQLLNDLRDMAAESVGDLSHKIGEEFDGLMEVEAEALAQTGLENYKRGLPDWYQKKDVQERIAQYKREKRYNAVRQHNAIVKELQAAAGRVREARQRTAEEPGLRQEAIKGELDALGDMLHEVHEAVVGNVWELGFPRFTAEGRGRVEELSQTLGQIRRRAQKIAADPEYSNIKTRISEIERKIAAGQLVLKGLQDAMNSVKPDPVRDSLLWGSMVKWNRHMNEYFLYPDRAATEARQRAAGMDAGSAAARAAEIQQEISGLGDDPSRRADDLYDELDAVEARQDELERMAEADAAVGRSYDEHIAENQARAERDDARRRGTENRLRFMRAKYRELFDSSDPSDAAVRAETDEAWEAYRNERDQMDVSDDALMEQYDAELAAFNREDTQVTSDANRRAAAKARLEREIRAQRRRAKRARARLEAERLAEIAEQHRQAMEDAKAKAADATERLRRFEEDQKVRQEAEHTKSEEHRKVEQELAHLDALQAELTAQVAENVEKYAARHMSWAYDQIMETGAVLPPVDIPGKEGGSPVDSAHVFFSFGKDNMYTAPGTQGILADPGMLIRDYGAQVGPDAFGDATGAYLDAVEAVGQKHGISNIKEQYSGFVSDAPAPTSLAESAAQPSMAKGRARLELLYDAHYKDAGVSKEAFDAFVEEADAAGMKASEDQKKGARVGGVEAFQRLLEGQAQPDSPSGRPWEIVLEQKLPLDSPAVMGVLKDGRVRLLTEESRGKDPSEWKFQDDVLRQEAEQHRKHTEHQQAMKSEGYDLSIKEDRGYGRMWDMEKFDVIEDGKVVGSYSRRLRAAGGLEPDDAMTAYFSERGIDPPAPNTSKELEAAVRGMASEEMQHRRAVEHAKAQADDAATRHAEYMADLKHRQAQEAESRAMRQQERLTGDTARFYADYPEGELTAESLAERTRSAGVDADSAEAYLEEMANAGMLTREGASYRATEAGAEVFENEDAVRTAHELLREKLKYNKKGIYSADLGAFIYSFRHEFEAKRQGGRRDPTAGIGAQDILDRYMDRFPQLEGMTAKEINDQLYPLRQAGFISFPAGKTETGATIWRYAARQLTPESKAKGQKDLDDRVAERQAYRRKELNPEAPAAQPKHLDELVEEQKMETAGLVEAKDLLRNIESGEIPAPPNLEVLKKEIADLEKSIAERANLIKAARAAMAKRGRPKDLPTGDTPKKKSGSSVRKTSVQLMDAAGNVVEAAKADTWIQQHVHGSAWVEGGVMGDAVKRAVGEGKAQVSDISDAMAIRAVVASVAGNVSLSQLLKDGEIRDPGNEGVSDAKILQRAKTNYSRRIATLIEDGTLERFMSEVGADVLAGMPIFEDAAGNAAKGYRGRAPVYLQKMKEWRDNRVRGGGSVGAALFDDPNLQGAYDAFEVLGEGGENLISEFYRPVKASELILDPDRFQFKRESDKATGDTGELKGEQEFKEIKGNAIIVWEDEGKYYVVDGHQRTNLAKRDLEQKGIDKTLRAHVIPSKNLKAEEARRLGALLNVESESATVMDYAFAFRDADPERLDEYIQNQRKTKKTAVFEHGAEIGQLEDTAFQIYTDHFYDKSQQTLPPNQAATVGRGTAGVEENKGEVQRQAMASLINNPPTSNSTDEALMRVERFVNGARFQKGGGQRTLAMSFGDVPVHISGELGQKIFARLSKVYSRLRGTASDVDIVEDIEGNAVQVGKTNEAADKIGETTAQLRVLMTSDNRFTSELDKMAVMVDRGDITKPEAVKQLINTFTEILEDDFGDTPKSDAVTETTRVATEAEEAVEAAAEAEAAEAERAAQEHAAFTQAEAQRQTTEMDAQRQATEAQQASEAQQAQDAADAEAAEAQAQMDAEDADTQRGIVPFEEYPDSEHTPFVYGYQPSKPFDQMSYDELIAEAEYAKVMKEADKRVLLNAYMEAVGQIQRGLEALGQSKAREAGILGKLDEQLLELDERREGPIDDLADALFARIDDLLKETEDLSAGAPVASMRGGATGVRFREMEMNEIFEEAEAGDAHMGIHSEEARGAFLEAVDKEIDRFEIFDEQAEYPAGYDAAEKAALDAVEETLQRLREIRERVVNMDMEAAAAAGMTKRQAELAQAEVKLRAVKDKLVQAREEWYRDRLTKDEADIEKAIADKETELLEEARNNPELIDELEAKAAEAAAANHTPIVLADLLEMRRRMARSEKFGDSILMRLLENDIVTAGREAALKADNKAVFRDLDMMQNSAIESLRTARASVSSKYREMLTHTTDPDMPYHFAQEFAKDVLGDGRGLGKEEVRRVREMLTPAARKAISLELWLQLVGDAMEDIKAVAAEEGAKTSPSKLPAAMFEDAINKMDDLSNKGKLDRVVEAFGEDWELVSEILGTAKTKGGPGLAALSNKYIQAYQARVAQKKKWRFVRLVGSGAVGLSSVFFFASHAIGSWQAAALLFFGPMALVMNRNRRAVGKGAARRRRSVWDGVEENMGLIRQMAIRANEQTLGTMGLQKMLRHGEYQDDSGWEIDEDGEIQDAGWTEWSPSETGGNDLRGWQEWTP